MAWSDVFAKVLEGRNYVKVVVLSVVVTLCVYFLLVYGVFHSLPPNTESAKASIGKVSTEILFHQVTSEGANEYLVVVSPQGWQETGIAVRAGDTVGFEAGGKANIDLTGLIDSLEERKKAEARVVAAEKKAGRWEKEKDNFAPEDHFTAEEKQLVIPHWRWVGPEGVDEAEMKKYANPARRQRTIRPDVGYGALLASVSETGVQPAQKDTSAVTLTPSITVARNGKLYFGVNDVMNTDLPELFTLDNVGFFYVRVTVSGKGSAKK